MGATRRSSSASTAMPESEAARLDRLRRNRISAAKCRVKRKAAAAQVEERVLALEQMNTRLLRENERLTKLLEAAGISAIKPPEPLVTSSDGLRLHKRSKHEHENRVNHSFDSSESAEEYPSGCGDHCSVLQLPASAVEVHAAAGSSSDGDLLSQLQGLSDSDYSLSEDGSSTAMWPELQGERETPRVNKRPREEAADEIDIECLRDIFPDLW